MKKQYLKTGMMVKWTDGTKLIVYKDVHNLRDCIVGEGIWEEINTYNDDLDSKYSRIDKIYKPKAEHVLGRRDEESYTLVWERPKYREIMIDGHTIKLSEESFQEIKKYFYKYNYN